VVFLTTDPVTHLALLENVFRKPRCMTVRANLRKKGKSSGSIAGMGKIAASVLLKLFINVNERCHTNDALSNIIQV